MPSTETLIPAPDAAAKLRMSRERLVRLILVGKISGEKRGSRYFVESREIARLKSLEPASAA